MTVTYPFAVSVSALAIPGHLTDFVLSKSRFSRAESRAFNKNFGRQAVGRRDHPHFDLVSKFEFGISDWPARNDNGDRKSPIGSMVTARARSKQTKSDKEIADR